MNTKKPIVFDEEMKTQNGQPNSKAIPVKTNSNGGGGGGGGGGH